MFKHLLEGVSRRPEILRFLGKNQLLPFQRLQSVFAGFPDPWIIGLDNRVDQLLISISTLAIWRLRASIADRAFAAY
ncbi:MAG: hypothetical protein QNJ44_04835 [Rhodobacter sp.]|nr:hypothetical protein [Rhodobacter sp.]